MKKAMTSGGNVALAAWLSESVNTQYLA